MSDFWGASNEACVASLAKWPSEWSPPVAGYDWWLCTLGMAIFLLVARHVLSVVLFRPLAKLYVGGGLTAVHSRGEFRRKHKTGDSDDDAGAIDPAMLVEKFVKYEWHLLFYCVLWPCVIGVLTMAPWSVFNNPTDLGLISTVSEQAKNPLAWVDDERDHCHVSWYIRLIFALEFAWYLHGMFETVIFDRTRGDFLMMLAHHVLAAMVIYFNVIFMVHRFGMYVLACLDFADIVLYCAKMFHLSTSNTMGRALSARYRTGQSLALVCLGIAWTVRMILFSFLIAEAWKLPQLDMDTSFYAMRNMITALGAMQWVWGLLLYRMVYSQLVNGEFDDVISNDAVKREVKKDK